MKKQNAKLIFTVLAVLVTAIFYGNTDAYAKKQVYSQMILVQKEHIPLMGIKVDQPAAEVQIC